MSEQPPPFQPSPIEPLRVESLEYHTPIAGAGRPGILVAVGIISITLGCVSILTSAGGAMMAVAFASMRGAASAIAAANTVHVQDAQNRPAIAMMSSRARIVAIAGLARKSPLSGPRLQMLDKLLSAAGDQMFPFDESVITGEKVAGSVNATGTAADSEGKPVQYFVIANGRVEIGDDQASFSPTHGDAVQVFRGDAAMDNSSQAVQPATMPALPPFFTAGPTSLRPFVFYGVACAASAALAVYLLIIGILILKRNRRGRGLHLAFAVLKILLEIFAGFAYVMVIDQISGGLAGAGGGLSIFAVGQTILACIYPVALLIVMNTRGVKQYYNSIAK